MDATWFPASGNSTASLAIPLNRLVLRHTEQLRRLGASQPRKVVAPSACAGMCLRVHFPSAPARSPNPCPACLSPLIPTSLVSCSLLGQSAGCARETPPSCRIAILVGVKAPSVEVRVPSLCIPPVVLAYSFPCASCGQLCNPSMPGGQWRMASYNAGDFVHA